MAKVKVTITLKFDEEFADEETIKNNIYELLTDKIDEDLLFDENCKYTVTEDDDDTPGDEDEDDE